MRYLHSIVFICVIVTPAMTADQAFSESLRVGASAISQGIDRLVEEQLDAHDQKPNRLTTDATFLRRIYLDVIGRIPTLDEAKSFLASKDRNKRASLIDELLNSPGYVSHQFNFWADILRLKNRLGGGNPGKPYVDFVKDALASNVPYDEFVHQLLTSEGPALERGNGATGYYLRDQGMPEDNMANTVRIFLGTRLECAQCHDHPFDKWTQREFFEMVAFTGGMQTRIAPSGMRNAQAVRRAIRTSDADARVKQIATNLVRPLTYGVEGTGTGLARLPDSYQYDDGDPNEIVTAKTLFEHKALVEPTIPVSRNVNRRPRSKRFKNAIPGAKDIGSRTVFAEWLTSPDNPRFTKVIVNRLWKKAFGIGLIDPVDDITDETVASNTKLLEYLAQQMIYLDYDMKQFFRAVYNSNTYQREASSWEVGAAAEYHFPGPSLRRMSAEQLWDSFLTLAVPELDARKNPRDKLAGLGPAGDAYQRFEQIKEMTVSEIMELAETELQLRNNPNQRRKKYRDAMMASNENRELRNENAAMREQLTDFRRLAKRARQRKNPLAARILQQKIRDLSKQLKHRPTRVAPDLVRASELPSPAPVGHFLREFGQSDREQIDNTNHEPAVTQVLSLMNGQIEKRIIANPRTVLMQNIVQAKLDSEKIDTVFLSMLSRNPQRSEKREWLNAAANDGSEAVTDLIWTLANTSEFMFIQ